MDNGISIRKDYASKGVAGAGLGLGIAGTALGLLGGNGGNILNGLLGGNSNYVSQLQSENAMLRAENYSDRIGKDVYSQTLADNKMLRDEIYAYLKPLSDEAVNNKVNIAVLQEQIKCSQDKADLREQIVIGKINELGLSVKGRFESIDNTIACLSSDVKHNTRRLNGITKEVIPTDAICPEVMQRYNSWVAPTTTTATT